ncbi:WecB/TagA/CpsF family glycosyltransferase [Micromonospora sp. NPDC006766]|uniref:WecB/TagA/CpsF family glycosyltransferase n=1 Tax=Micromonospora sp. NPDC006766 TaxID=3154778 RepID=UPI0033F864D1
MSDTMRPPVPCRRTLFGIDLDALTLGETVQRCVDAVGSGDRLEVGVVNAAKVVNMLRDPRLRAAVTGCDIVVADGQSVVWASRILRTRLPERVAGIDLFVRLLAEAERRGLSVYFLGARPVVLDAMIDRLRERFPALKIAGRHHGYFADTDAAAIADTVAASGAQLLFLGMTSPKKENFMAEFGDRTGVAVAHGVGGSFDVLAGVVKRAPRSWQRLGFEWLYRLLQEPRRLGGRYLTTNLMFVALVASELVRLRRPADRVTAVGRPRRPEQQGGS